MESLVFSAEVCDLQHWLNDHGAGIIVDGIGGPKTRRAIFDVFRNTDAPAVNRADKIVIAQRLGGTVRQVNAFSKVEAPRGGWDSTGLLTCLYERHYTWKRVRIIVPFLSNPKPGGYTIDIDDDGINDSWEKVADAACRWGQVAFECASWGKFQIMGAWWKKLGYKSVLDFVWALSRDEAAHYDAFARYMEKFGLVDAFSQISEDPEDNRPVAKGYNGSGYRKYSYHVRLADAMKVVPG